MYDDSKPSFLHNTYAFAADECAPHQETRCLLCKLTSWGDKQAIDKADLVRDRAYGYKVPNDYKVHDY